MARLRREGSHITFLLDFSQAPAWSRPWPPLPLLRSLTRTGTHTPVRGGSLHKFRPLCLLSYPRVLGLSRCCLGHRTQDPCVRTAFVTEKAPPLSPLPIPPIPGLSVLP